jgi:hypothetical protein
MKEDAKKYVLRCPDCQKFAANTHQHPNNLINITAPWPFHMWGLDIIGPLIEQERTGYKFVLVACDYFTKWIEAIPLSNIKQGDVRKFIWENIITRFGLPKRLITDNGTQFVGKDIKAFYTLWKIEHSRSAPRYPQCNGQAEAANRQILEVLKKKLEIHASKWPNELENVLWAYRTTPRSSTGMSPFSLCFGVEAVIPTELTYGTSRSLLVDTELNNQLWSFGVDLLEERRYHAAKKLEQYQQQLKRAYNKGVRPRTFQPGEMVMRRMFPNKRLEKIGKFNANWEGPYIIKNALGNGAYRLQTQEGEDVKNPWNSFHLKKFYQ